MSAAICIQQDLWLMPAIHAQETCIRNFVCKKVAQETCMKNLTQVHHSFLHKNNSPANDVAGSCHVLDSLCPGIELYSTACKKLVQKKLVQDWPTHVQVSCTRRLAQVSVASFLSGITNEITNSVYWQQEHYGTTDIVDVFFWRRLRFPAQSRSRTVAPLHAPCPFHCTLVPRGQQATSRLHHQLMWTERARARITCEWPMHLRQNRAQHLVDNVHNIATITTSSVRPASLSHHSRSALSSDYK